MIAHVSISGYSKGQIEMYQTDYSADPSMQSVAISTHEFEIDIPEFDVVEKEVVFLKEQREIAYQEFLKKAEIIDNRMQSLLCIENNPTTSEV
jgi:hypothetical protein